ncbi:hypothetical protein DFH94DRAFT_756631 [Russula ochroleuca]|uniref:Uncharacterized protein n=1 Tax=Russula ochroleuca TaxID=152965 RepID=A0A9P5MS59_9AGAM|nr:hypothetical protein DFH94DRAFT_756631 [Russula ochroleuca]
MDLTPRYVHWSVYSSGSKLRHGRTPSRSSHAPPSRVYCNLACVEQLVPLLSLDTIEPCVIPLCLPYAQDLLAGALGHSGDIRCAVGFDYGGVSP